MALEDISGVGGAGSGGITAGGSGGGFDAQDTFANLNALPREQGKLYYATDTDVAYTDDGAALQPLSGTGITLTQVANNEVVEYHALTLGEITAKEMTLAASPFAVTKTKLSLIEGLAAEYGVDFIVAGDKLNWNALALDGELLTGDKLRITYRVITL